MDNNAENEKVITALNKLIVINNDRIEGYDTASKETEDAELKELFVNLAKTSHQNREGLIHEVRYMNGKEEEGTRVTGKFFRVWMDVKAALSSNERKAILESCEFGEKVALDTYETVLVDSHSDLSTEQKMMLNKQMDHLKADGQLVKHMSEEVATEK